MLKSVYDISEEALQVTKSIESVEFQFLIPIFTEMSFLSLLLPIGLSLRVYLKTGY